MKYRIMKIGNKFAAQIIKPDGTGGDYIQRDGKNNWSVAQYVINNCTCESLEEANQAGQAYVKPYNEIAEAIEVKELCPVCNELVETKQYHDCCSAQCYKDKHV